MSNDLIERFLRNNLDDDDYKEYSVALDELCTPKRLWVGLTDEDMGFLFPHGSTAWVKETVKIVEAKLKEKNT